MSKWKLSIVQVEAGHASYRWRLDWYNSSACVPIVVSKLYDSWREAGEAAEQFISTLSTAQKTQASEAHAVWMLMDKFNR